MADNYTKRPFDKGYHDGYHNKARANSHTGDDSEAYERGYNQGIQEREFSVKRKAGQA